MAPGKEICRSKYAWLWYNEEEEAIKPEFGTPRINQEGLDDERGYID